MQDKIDFIDLPKTLKNNSKNVFFFSPITQKTDVRLFIQRSQYKEISNNRNRKTMVIRIGKINLKKLENQKLWK